MFQLLSSEIHMCIYIHIYISPLVLHWSALAYSLGFYKLNHSEITKYYKAITIPSIVLVSEVQSGPCLE